MPGQKEAARGQAVRGSRISAQKNELCGNLETDGATDCIEYVYFSLFYRAKLMHSPDD